MVMFKKNQQTGAAILAAVVFLIVAGSVMLYAMTNLSMVSSASTRVAHNGNMALMAAQSGLKYCVAQLENGDCLSDPFTKDISSPNYIPCKIKITIGGEGDSNQNDGKCDSAAPSVCTITSTACCPNSTPADSYRGAKSLKIDVQKTTGGYQMIPASRRVVTPDTCPL